MRRRPGEVRDAIVQVLEGRSVGAAQGHKGKAKHRERARVEPVNPKLAWAVSAFWGSGDGGSSRRGSGLLVCLSHFS